MYKAILLSISILVLSLIVFSYGFGQEVIVTEIRGVIKDKDTDSPLENAIIEAIDGGISNVLSDPEGRYRFFLVNAPTITLKITKKGYKTYLRTISPIELVEVDIRLESEGKDKVSIAITEFRSSNYIKGHVFGFKESDYKKYKILVYVLTDKWYIHPYAENIEERGYATIRSDGSWRIGTVWRGFQAYKIAVLMVDKDFFPPSIIQTPGGEAEKSLIERTQPYYYSIKEAPKGI